MRTLLQTCIRFLVLASIGCGVGCSHQSDQPLEIEGINSIEVKPRPSAALAELAWSPDGHSVAAHAYGERTGSTVTVIDLQTGTARSLYDSGGDYFLGPEWSPDGQSLVFVAPTSKVNPRSGGAIIVDADTGNVTHDLGFGGYATWTADIENVIVLEFDSNCREEIPIFEYNLVTSTRRIFGSTISCFAETGDSLDASTDGKLVVPDSTGTKTQILSIVDGVELGALSPPLKRNTVWSPDGTILAFLVRVVDSQVTNDGIIFASADGACLSDPLQLGAELLSLDWSPDGNQLVFSTRDTNRLYFLDLTSGVGKQLMDSFRERCTP